LHTPRGLAFIVKQIVSAQRMAVKLGEGRIIRDREKAGQNLLAKQLEIGRASCRERV